MSKKIKICLIIGNLLDDVVKSAREQIEMEKVKNEFIQRN